MKVLFVALSSFSCVISFFLWIIIIIIHRINARRSPMSHLFLTRWVSQLLGLALVSWAFARIGVHRHSLRLPYLMFSILYVFHSLFLPSDFNRVSSLRPTYRHPFGRPFTYSLLGEFSGLGLALEPAAVDPEAEQGCAWNRNLEPNFCPGRGRTSDLGIYRSRTLPLDYRTTPFFKSPLRLRHAGGYGGTILTPNPHVILLLIKLQISKLPDFKIFKKLPHHLLL